MEIVIHALAGLGLIVLVVIGYLLFRFLPQAIRASLDGNKDIGDRRPAAESLLEKLVSTDITILPVDVAGWNAPENVNGTCMELAQHGYDPLGPYQGVAGYNPCEALLHRDGTIALVAERGGNWRISICLIGLLEDGSMISVSNHSVGHCLPLPPHENHVRKDAAKIPELIAALSDILSDRSTLRVIRRNEVSAALAHVMEQRVWHLAAHPQRVAVAIEQLQLGGSHLGTALNQSLAGIITSCCRMSFLKQADLSALAWEEMRDRLIVIHDWLVGRELIQQLGGFDASWSPRNERASTTEHGRVMNREIYAKHLHTMDERMRPTKIATVEEPIAADIYLTHQPYLQT